MTCLLSLASADATELALEGEARFRLSLDATDWRRPDSEIYDLRLVGTRESDGFAAFADVRARQTPFRPHSPSNVWVEQAYARWSPADGIQVAAGLLYNQLGLFWDGAWFGNLPYLNGHKLDPDFNAELRVERRGFTGWIQLSPAEDGLNGSLVPTSKLQRLDIRPDLETSSNFREGPALRLRAVPSIQVKSVRLEPGLSFQQSLYDRVVTERTGRHVVWAGELTARVDRLTLLMEALFEEIADFDDVAFERDYLLFGAEYQVFDRPTSTRIRRLTAGASWQRVDYANENLEEWFMTIRVVARINELIGTTVEYVRWEFGDDDPILDHVECVLHVYY